MRVVRILLTTLEPLSAIEPMPWLIDAEVAFVEFHVSVEEPPYCTELGLAEMVQLGACCGWTVTVVWQFAGPPGPSLPTHAPRHTEGCPPSAGELPAPGHPL